MSEWKTYKLVEVSDILTGFPFKGEKYDPLKGIKVLRGENVSLGYLRWDTLKHWNDEFNQVEKYSLKSGDIVIGMDGSRVGKNRAQIKQNDLPLLLAQRVARVRAHKQFSQDFLAHIIKGDRFEQYVKSVHTGTSIPHISLKQIEQFEIQLPNFNTQYQIASILSSLDNKIELLREMNQTLENIAQAVFKEWFVEFKFPGFDGKLMNGLPIGWKKGTIKDISSNIRSPFNPNQEKSLNYIGLEHIPKKMVMPVKWGSSVDISSQKSQFEQGDILFGKLRPYFHKVIISPIDGVCSTDILVIKSKNWYDQYYTFFQLYSDDCISYSTSHSDGTRMPRVNWKSLSNYAIPLPTESTLILFQQTTKSLFDRILANIRYTNQLIQTRDTLLPQLMSGKIKL